MLIPPNIDTYNEVKEAFTSEFLCKFCSPLKLSDEDLRIFAEFLIIVTARYLELKRINPKVLTPSQQEKLFEKFNSALCEARAYHQQILDDKPSEAKFYTALRTSYPSLDDGTKSLLKPYVDSAGYAAGLLNNLFDLLSTTSIEAKNISFGKERSDKSANYLAWWTAEIRRHWPKKALINFGLADWLKEGGGYKSCSSEILYQLIHKVDGTITPQNIETAIRKAIKIDINENPAKLILE